MDNLNNSYVTKEEFDAAIGGLIAALSVLGVVLLIFIVLASIAICFLILKLRELYLLPADVERNVPSQIKRNRQTDSAIALSDGGWRDSQQSTEEASGEPPGSSPAIELVIKKETVNLYGRKPAIDQVLSTAQNFYKAHTESTEDCPAEFVQIIDKQSNQRLARSTVFSEDWMEGMPTSLLIEASARNFEDILSHNKGLFIHRKIGPDGGVLFTSGVRLKIPKGALSETTLITLGITWDERFMPTLAARQSLLSPVVLCQPSGLKFKVPVTLSFPHAAHDILKDWNPCILKRDGDLQSDSEWTSTTLADYEERLVTHSRIKLRLHHFTLYTCTGTSKPGVEAAKLVHVVAFAGKLTRNAFFKPRLYCINSYEDELQGVEGLENKLDPSSRMAETTDLLVKDNGCDVIVEMSKLSEEWTLAGDKQESLPFELVWHACHPHCTFIMKPKKPSNSDILCEIHTFQSGNENNFTRLKIAEQISTPSSPLSEEQDPKCDLINTLIILLDPSNEAGTAGDWRALAEKMGCDLARIRWLATATQSPTRVLIDKWFEDKKSLTELAETMVSIDRLDAAEEIRSRLHLFIETSET